MRWQFPRQRFRWLCTRGGGQALRWARAGLGWAFPELCSASLELACFPKRHRAVPGDPCRGRTSCLRPGAGGEDALPHVEGSRGLARLFSRTVTDGSRARTWLLCPAKDPGPRGCSVLYKHSMQRHPLLMGLVCTLLSS